MSDKTVYLFNRWFRTVIGLLFIGVAIYYKDWWPAAFGAIFLIQAIQNRGCHGECYTPNPDKKLMRE